MANQVCTLVDELCLGRLGVISLVILSEQLVILFLPLSVQVVAILLAVFEVLLERAQVALVLLNILWRQRQSFRHAGWRVGWLVAPQEYVECIERLSQNIFISSSATAQYGALRALCLGALRPH